MKFLPLIALALIVFSACSKDDDNEPTDRMQLITSSAWKLNSAGIDGNNDGKAETPLPDGTLEPCETDNLFTFRSDGTGTADEGATKCEETDPQSTEFSWNFTNNQQSVVFNDAIFTGIDGEVKILSLTSSTMTLSKELDLGLPVPITIIVEMKH